MKHKKNEMIFYEESGSFDKAVNALKELEKKNPVSNNNENQPDLTLINLTTTLI